MLADEDGLPLGFDVTTAPYPGAHFATWPAALVEPMVLAGSRHGDLVLDNFNGSGTTGEVCQRWGRRYVGTDLNTEYLELAKGRFVQRCLFPPTPEVA
jgi:DNA modification methylase